MARQAREAGLSREEIDDISRFPETDRFEGLEKRALELADAMTDTPANIPDELFKALSKELAPKQLVELAGAIALENFSARFNHAFGIQTDPADRQSPEPAARAEKKS